MKNMLTKHVHIVLKRCFCARNISSIKIRPEALNSYVRYVLKILYTLCIKSDNLERKKNLPEDFRSYKFVFL